MNITCIKYAQSPQRAFQAGPGSDAAKRQPSYLLLNEKGILKDRIMQAYSYFENCELCPHRCGVARDKNETGICQAPKNAVINNHQPHFGEENPLVGSRGSGTIFFSHCNLRCVFCQNPDIAHGGTGREISDEALADMMLELQHRGCHNINLVTPTHAVPNIISAIQIAADKGLTLPICYNTGGYERVEGIKLLDGIVDIYLADMKFMNSDEAERYNLSNAADYPQKAKSAIIEMLRQTGNLISDKQGIAISGLMIRHLVMPNRIAGTREFVNWVANSLSPKTYVNIMAQYRPEFMAHKYKPIARAILCEEFVEAVQWAIEAGLKNLDETSLRQFSCHRLKG